MSLAALIDRARDAARREVIPEAIGLYREALMLAPGDGNLHRNLGVLLLRAGQSDEAVTALTRATELAPELPAIRLQLGRALEATGAHEAAVRHYFRALVKAQMSEQWLDQTTTPPALWPLVQHAARVAERGRKDILMGLLEPVQQEFGRDTMARIASAVQGYLGLVDQPPGSPHQRPRFLYIPGLREQPFYAPSEFAWVDALQAASTDITREALTQWQQGDALQPFLDFQRPDDAKHFLGDAKGAAWNAYFFFRSGARFDAHHAECPATSAALAATDPVHIGGHAPEVCFSILTAGTHILPHTGVTNLRLTVHLPLRIPPDCALRVAGEERAWTPGEVLVFDDTFEHEAWNRSRDTRIILLMDTWHPDLRPEERVAITSIIEGIGAFHRD